MKDAKSKAHSVKKNDAKPSELCTLQMKVFGEGRSKISGSLANAEQACDSVLSLPVEPLQDEKTTGNVVDCLRRWNEK